MGTEFEHFEKIVEESNTVPTDALTEEAPATPPTEEAPATPPTEEAPATPPTEEAPEVADPLDDLPDDVKEYAAAKKQNKELTFEDFQKEKNFDINSLSLLDTAREKAIRESNGKITKENVDKYLEKKTGIILTDDEVEIDEYDEIDLEKFIGDFRESFAKKEDGEKEDAEKAEDPKVEEELIEIENGFKIEKSIYEGLQKTQQEFVSRMEKSVENTKEINFEFEFDNNGTKEIIPLSYTTTEADKQVMLSAAKDVNNEVDKMFRDKDGNFNDDEFTQGLLRLNPNVFKKMVNTLVNKAVAISTEKLLKQEYNPNFQGSQFRQEMNPQSKNQGAMNRPPGTLQIDVT